MTKVLVVDDSNSIRDMVSFTLKSAGYETVEAKDGDEGLAKAKMGSFDLVISDVNMPNMDGLTLVKELRAIGTNASAVAQVSLSIQPAGGADSVTHISKEPSLPSSVETAT